MSKLFDLLDILKNMEEIKSLIDSQKGTVKFVESRLQKMSAFDDEERLKNMGESASRDLEILEPHYADLCEKYQTLLQSAKSDSKVLGEVETLKVSNDYKKHLETLKQDLLSQSGYERPEE